MWAAIYHKILSIFRGKGPRLEIDYRENDKKYYYRAAGEQLYRVFIINSGWNTIKEGMVAITDMRPRHDVFNRGFPTLRLFSIGRGETPVDVIRWVYDKKTQKYEFIQGLKIIPSEFPVTGTDYEITITVSGKKIEPVSRKFSFGIERAPDGSDTFWFRPVDQAHER